LCFVLAYCLNAKQTYATVTAPNLLLQQDLIFVQNQGKTIQVTVPATLQQNIPQSGFSYVLTGETDSNYWFQWGLSYNYGTGTGSNTWTMSAEGFNALGACSFQPYIITPVKFTGNVKANDNIQLTMSINPSTGTVTAVAQDESPPDQGSSATYTFPDSPGFNNAGGSTMFIGADQDEVSSNCKGTLFTGLMTLQYFVSPNPIWYIPATPPTPPVMYSSWGGGSTSQPAFLNTFETNQAGLVYSYETSTSVTPIGGQNDYYLNANSLVSSYSSDGTFTTGLGSTLTESLDDKVIDQGEPEGLEGTQVDGTGEEADYGQTLTLSMIDSSTGSVVQTYSTPAITNPVDYDICTDSSDPTCLDPGSYLLNLVIDPNLQATQVIVTGPYANNPNVLQQITTPMSLVVNPPSNPTDPVVCTNPLYGSPPDCDECLDSDLEFPACMPDDPEPPFGTITSPTNNYCPSTQSFSSGPGQCILSSNLCPNGATNPSACSICPSGAVVAPASGGLYSSCPANPACPNGSPNSACTCPDGSAPAFRSQSSDGATVGQCITPTTSTTSLSCSPTSFDSSGSATCTATVGSSVPNGEQVTFSSTAGSFSPQPSCYITSGTCSITYTGTDEGTQTITATYSGDTTFSGSSGTASIVINSPSSTSSSSSTVVSSTVESSTVASSTVASSTIQSSTIESSTIESSTAESSTIESSTILGTSGTSGEGETKPTTTISQTKLNVFTPLISAFDELLAIFYRPSPRFVATSYVVSIYERPTNATSGGGWGNSTSTWGACVNETGYKQICVGHQSTWTKTIQSNSISVPSGTVINYLCAAPWILPTPYYFRNWSGVASTYQNLQCETNLAITVNSNVNITAHYTPGHPTVYITENPTAAASTWGACVNETGQKQTCVGTEHGDGTSNFTLTNIPVGSYITYLCTADWAGSSSYIWESWSGFPFSYTTVTSPCAENLLIPIDTNIHLVANYEIGSSTTSTSTTTVSTTSVSTSTTTIPTGNYIKFQQYGLPSGKEWGIKGYSSACIICSGTTTLFNLQTSSATTGGVLLSSLQGKTIYLVVNQNTTPNVSVSYPNYLSLSDYSVYPLSISSVASSSSDITYPIYFTPCGTGAPANVFNYSTCTNAGSKGVPQSAVIFHYVSYLPSGGSWTLTIGTRKFTSTSPTIIVTLPQGTYGVHATNATGVNTIATNITSNYINLVPSGGYGGDYNIGMPKISVSISENPLNATSTRGICVNETNEKKICVGIQATNGIGANIITNSILVPYGSNITYLCEYYGVPSEYQWTNYSGISVPSYCNTNLKIPIKSSINIVANYHLLEPTITIFENPLNATNTWSECVNETGQKQICVGHQTGWTNTIYSNSIKVPYKTDITYLCTAKWTTPSPYTWYNWIGISGVSSSCNTNLNIPVVSNMNIAANYNGPGAITTSISSSTTTTTIPATSTTTNPTTSSTTTTIPNEVVSISESPTAATNTWGACVIAGSNPQICVGHNTGWATEITSNSISVPKGSEITYLCTAQWVSPSPYTWLSWSGVTAPLRCSASGWNIPVNSNINIVANYQTTTSTTPTTTSTTTKPTTTSTISMAPLTVSVGTGDGVENYETACVIASYAGVNYPQVCAGTNNHDVASATQQVPVGSTLSYICSTAPKVPTSSDFAWDEWQWTISGKQYTTVFECGQTSSVPLGIPVSSSGLTITANFYYCQYGNENYPEC
jgi:hypothetical protein